MIPVDTEMLVKCHNTLLSTFIHAFEADLPGIVNKAKFQENWDTRDQNDMRKLVHIEVQYLFKMEVGTKINLQTSVDVHTLSTLQH